MELKNLNKFVINLPSRVDRLECISQELPYLFDDHAFVLIEGITGPNIKMNIAQAHMNCIKAAKFARLPYCLIMEDDCVFPAKHKTRDYVEQCLANIPEDWNILLGGVYESAGMERVNEFWNKTEQFCALHFYIVNENCYDRLLDYDGVHHFDRFINYNNDLNCYVAAKMFALQSDGYSDNAMKNVNYQSKLKHFDVLTLR